MEKERFKDAREKYRYVEWRDEKKALIDKAWKWVESNLFPAGARLLEVWEKDFRECMEE